MKQLLFFVALFFCVCFTTKASDEFVEIKTPSMVEYLKEWYKIQPNKDGLYSMDSLQRVYRYKVTELPLPQEFKCLKNISNISIILDKSKNDTKENILDLRPFPHQFNKYLAIVSLSPIRKIIVGEEPDLSMLVISYNCQELDVSKCTGLRKLVCRNSGLKKLDLKDNANLEELDCSQNQLVYLDLSQYKRLQQVDCSNNFFPTMDSLLLPRSIANLTFVGNKFSSRPQYLYLKSYPKMEILHVSDDIVIRFK